ncbi:MAG: hypothetical protein IJD35_06465 [Clostridia bacterium]|nr:hypothetical protein [Clostridia bacterium]
MKLKNISQKVISIGSIVLMPDKDIPITAQKAKLPSIKALIKAGFLSIDDSEEKLEAAKKEAAEAARKQAEADAAKKAEEEAAQKEKEEAAKKEAADKKRADKAAAEQK